MDFEFLEKKRIAERFTVVEFCKRVGVDTSTYYRWKSNPGCMRIDHALRVVEVLQLSAADKKKLFA